MCIVPETDIEAPAATDVALWTPVSVVTIGGDVVNLQGDPISIRGTPSGVFSWFKRNAGTGGTGGTYDVNWDTTVFQTGGANAPTRSGATVTVQVKGVYEVCIGVKAFHTSAFSYWASALRTSAGTQPSRTALVGNTCPGGGSRDSMVWACGQMRLGAGATLVVRVNFSPSTINDLCAFSGNCSIQLYLLPGFDTSFTP